MINQPDMSVGPEGEEIIVDNNPDFKEIEVYCGRCNTKMIKVDLKRYKCSKCGLEKIG